MATKSITQTEIFAPITVEIGELAIALIDPHPLNPRPYSEKYEANVMDDHVASLAQSISTNGYDPSEPIKVRPLGDRYQLTRGHHRWAACGELGYLSIPAVIEEMTDAEAAIAVITEQGKEPSSWEICRHAFRVCTAYGRDGLMTVSEYAEKMGISQPVASQKVNAGKVGDCIEDSIQLSAYALMQISTLPESDWEMVVDWCIEKKPSEKERTEAIQSVKAIDIPEDLQDWLNPTEQKQKALKTPKYGNRVKLWVETSQTCLEHLLESYGDVVTLHTIEDEEVTKTLEYDVAQNFYDGLLDIKSPSAKAVNQVADQISGLIDANKQVYSAWEARQRSQEEQERQQRETERQERERQARYFPVGHNACIKEMNFEPDSFDLCLTDPPYLLSDGGITCRGSEQVPVDKNFDDDPETAITPDEWMPIVFDALKPGGVLVCTLTWHLADLLLAASSDAGFEPLEDLYWIKNSAPPRLTPTGHRAVVEPIYVFKKPGQPHYFGYEESKSEEGTQPSNALRFEQCAGNERLGWHDTQKPLDLWLYLLEAYSPHDACVLDPFAGTATTAIACQQLERRCVWIEKVEDFFIKASGRIEGV